ncbi:hypothetical protein EXIGLDRAFT_774719 [Exidia glandulosa HHB12029]|uniref:3'-5' exonuclease domain-containing protein n=1 Tax=Exidia glandulosa HHB12029 TaxID=1314781 RepID=A0A165E8K4_EXIGL|nr:hypothetical protein EXIGLDRAFT_774719 [Exidia glandulosa HHB12029]
MERPSDPLHRVRHLDTSGIHGLGGLKGALREHGIDAIEMTQAKKCVDHTQWLARPLPLQYTAYAAEDIWILSKVFEVFHARAYFRSPELEMQSQRYVNMHRGVPPQSGDIYRSSNLLPMEIIVAPVAQNSSRVCEGCHRVLGDACFFFRAHGYALVHTMHSHCKVCYILTQRMIIKATPRVKHRPRGNTHWQERWTAQEPPQVQNVAFRDALPKDPETCEKELEAVLKRISAA